MEHPQALAAEKSSGPVVLFARNRLCALVTARPRASRRRRCSTRCCATHVKVGTSTPKADPATMPGRCSPRPRRQGRQPGHTGEEGAAAHRRRRERAAARGTQSLRLARRRRPRGCFLTYCTAATVAVRENPGQQMVALPDALAVGADYGAHGDERRVRRGASLRDVHPVRGGAGPFWQSTGSRRRDLP